MLFAFGNYVCVSQVHRSGQVHQRPMSVNDSSDAESESSGPSRFTRSRISMFALSSFHQLFAQVQLGSASLCLQDQFMWLAFFPGAMHLIMLAILMMIDSLVGLDLMTQLVTGVLNSLKSLTLSLRHSLTPRHWFFQEGWIQKSINGGTMKIGRWKPMCTLVLALANADGYGIKSEIILFDMGGLVPKRQAQTSSLGGYKRCKRSAMWGLSRLSVLTAVSLSFCQCLRATVNVKPCFTDWQWQLHVRASALNFVIVMRSVWDMGIISYCF